MYNIEVECFVDSEEFNIIEVLLVVSVDGIDEIESSVLIEIFDGDECIEKKVFKEWYIGRVENGSVSKMYVSRVIKMLFLCEFIFCNCL